MSTASIMSTFSSPFRSAAGSHLACPGLEPKAFPHMAMSSMFTCPSPFRSSFFAGGPAAEYT